MGGLSVGGTKVGRRQVFEILRFVRLVFIYFRPSSGANAHECAPLLLWGGGSWKEPHNHVCCTMGELGPSGSSGGLNLSFRFFPPRVRLGSPS